MSLNLKKRLPELLPRLRLLAGLSRRDLAREAGIPWQSVGHWEAGRRTPSAQALHRLARALKVPVERFLEDEDSSPAA